MEKEDDLNAVSVYPNPATEWVEIKMPEWIQNPIAIRLIDLNGKDIRPMIEADGHTGFYVRDLARGMYILELSGEGGIARRKLVLN